MVNNDPLGMVGFRTLHDYICGFANLLLAKEAREGVTDG